MARAFANPHAGCYKLDRMALDSKRALFVIGSLESGGTERQLLQVLPRLAAYGWTADILPLAGPTPLADAFEAAGLRVLRRPARTGTRIGRALGAIAALAAVCRERRHDAIMLCLSMAYAVGGPVALLAGNAPLAMMRRNVNDRQTGFPLRAVERAMHRRAAGFLVNAPDLVAQLAGEGAPADRIAFVRNGIDLGRFAALVDRDVIRRSLHVPQDGVAVLCVANFHTYKRHVDVVCAFAGLSQKQPDARLWLVGRPGEADGAVRAEIAAQGLGDRIAMLGARDDVPDLARAADIGILMSAQEGTPNAVLESMAAGSPVVGSDLPGIRDALGAEDFGPCDSGWLVQGGDIAGAAAALIALAADPALRRRTGAAARARIEREFSLDAAAAGYAALLDATTLRGRR